MEREGAINAAIVIELPAGFEVESCKAEPGWTCDVAGAVVTWKRADAPPSTDDHVSFVGHTPVKEGSYPIVVRQTYSDGVVADWSGPEASANPAPVLEVTKAGECPAHEAGDHHDEPAPSGSSSTMSVVPAHDDAAAEECDADEHKKDADHKKDAGHKDKDGDHKDGHHKDKDGDHKDGHHKDKDGDHKDGHHKDKDADHKDKDRDHKDRDHKDGDDCDDKDHDHKKDH